jgi:hypothetical protein
VKIREQISERMKNMSETPQSLIRLFVESADELFSFSSKNEHVKIGGRAQVINAAGVFNSGFDARDY